MSKCIDCWWALCKYLFGPFRTLLSGSHEEHRWESGKPRSIQLAVPFSVGDFERAARRWDDERLQRFSLLRERGFLHQYFGKS